MPKLITVYLEKRLVGEPHISAIYDEEGVTVERERLFFFDKKSAAAHCREHAKAAHGASRVRIEWWPTVGAGR